MWAHADQAFWRKLAALAIPISMQSMLFSVLGLVDILMVARLGDSSVAAVGLAGRVFFMNLLVIFGISGAMSILAAQYFGANNQAGIRQVIVQSLLLSTLFCLPFVIFYLINPFWIVSLASNDPEVIALAAHYLWITAPSFIATIIVVPLESALRSIGQAKIATYIGIVAIVANIVLNALLIFGLFGFPALGVAGSAWGTALSRLLQTILIVWLIIKAYPELIPRKADIKAALTKHKWRIFLVLAIPLMLHDGLWAMGVFGYQIIFGQMSTNALAIMSLLAPIESILFSGFFGLAVAASTMLGHELGANNFERARKQSWVFIVCSPFIALLVALIVYPISEPMAYFMNGLQTPLPNTAITLSIIAFGLVFKVINMVGIMGILRSGGDLKFGIYVDILALWLVGLPMAFFVGLVLKASLPIVVAAILAEELVKIGFVIFRIHQGKWLKNLVQ